MPHLPCEHRWDLFFPPGGKGYTGPVKDAKRIEAALALCNVCPYIVQCEIKAR